MAPAGWVAPVPGPHGGDGARLASALGVEPGAVLDLSASLNPLAPEVAPVVAAHLDALGRYPDPEPATDALARAFGVDPARMLLTNGGAEAISLVASELGGWTEEPDFGLYPRRPASAVAAHSRNSDEPFATSRSPGSGTGGPRWLSNPHNPSGRLASPGTVAGVWDEAFYPLATARWTNADADPAAVVVGSLTKVFACPGLRVGYVLAPDSAMIARLSDRQPQWSLNGLAAAAVPDLLDMADLGQWQAGVAALRADLAALLAAHGMEPEPSDANYLLVEAPGLRERLAPEGVLVRDCASFGLARHCRVAVPDWRGLERLAAALEHAGVREGRMQDFQGAGAP